MTVVDFHRKKATQKAVEWREPPQLITKLAGGVCLILTMYVHGRLSADLLLPEFVGPDVPTERFGLVNVVVDIANVWMNPPMEDCADDTWTLEVGEASFYMPSQAEASRVIEFLANLPGDRSA